MIRSDEKSCKQQGKELEETVGKKFHLPISTETIGINDVSIYFFFMTAVGGDHEAKSGDHEAKNSKNRLHHLYCGILP